MTRIVTTHPDLPARVGPAEFSTLGAMVVVRCPHDLDPLMRKAGGLWEPGGSRALLDPGHRHYLSEEGKGSGE